MAGESDRAVHPGRDGGGAAVDAVLGHRLAAQGAERVLRWDVGRFGAPDADAHLGRSGEVVDERVEVVPEAGKTLVRIDPNCFVHDQLVYSLFWMTWPIRSHSTARSASLSPPPAGPS